MIRRRIKTLPFVVAVIVSIWPGSLSGLQAQEIRASVGDRVRVRPVGALRYDVRSRIVGTLVAHDDSITVRRRDASLAKLAIVDIMSLDVARGQTNYSGVGFALGALAGFGIGAATGSFAAGTGIGGIAGFFGGLAIKGDRWQEAKLGPP